MKNVHLLSTDKLIKSAGDLVKDKYGSIHIFTKNDGKEYGKTTTKLNIYITSDEGIKEGDWFIHPDSSCFDKEWKEVSIGGYEILQVIKVDENFIYHSSMMAIHKNLNIKKIILTTDQDLIKDGVQAIDDEFLEWFVKNPSCESVEVGYGFIRLTETDNEGYWVSIPNEQIEMQQEEPKQETLENESIFKNKKWYSENGTVYNKADDSVRIALVFDNGSYMNLPIEIANKISQLLNN